MPRPRSSTFYLPLAPIDAPLELKAKLSVLPPSAANALLAPRTSFSRPPHPHPYQQQPLGCPPSSSTTTATKEDECTRLNRVLGIPTGTTGTNTLTVPSPHHIGMGRRRHTDAPKPSFPLTRSPNSGPSPLAPPSPAPIPASGSDWAIDYSQKSTTATITNMPPVTPPPDTEQDTEKNMVGLSKFTESDEAIIDARNSTDISTSASALQGSTLALASNMVTEDNQTESSSMAWTRTTTQQDSARGIAIDIDMTASDMDMFAGACDVQNPVVLHTDEVVYLHSPPVSRPTTATAVPPRARTPIAPIQEEEEEEAQPAQLVHVRSPLSGLPCGALQVWACRPRVPSRLLSEASSSSPAPLSTLCAPVSGSLPPSDSLHPQDTRHLLRKEFRIAFPPPPAPSPCAAASIAASSASAASSIKDLHHPHDEVSLFVDESIPGLAEIQASFPPIPTQVITPVVAKPCVPRQRFRLAPLYLPKVLRRSLGATAWARAETLRAARMEGLHGWSAAGAAGAGIGEEWRGQTGQTGSNSWVGGGATSTWWGRIPDIGSSSTAGTTAGSRSYGSELVWSGYEDVYSAEDEDEDEDDEDDEDGDDDMEVELKDLDEDDEEELRCIWDWDEEEVMEPVRVHGQDLDLDYQHHGFDGGSAMEEDEVLNGDDDDGFVREGAPEPEEPPHRRHSSSSRPEQIQIPRLAVSSTTVYSLESPTSVAITQISPGASGTGGGSGDPALVTGYSMVGRFDWDSTWPASPTSPQALDPLATAAALSLVQDAASLSPTVATVPIKMPPVTRRAVRREDGGMIGQEEEEEEIFRYSPLKLGEDQQHDVNVDMDECYAQQQQQPDYLHTQSMSSCSTPTATSPSFPPGPLRGVTISSSFEDGYLECKTPEEEVFYDADGDAAMEDYSSEAQRHSPVVVSRSHHIRAPRPLSLVQQQQHPVLHHQYPVFPDSDEDATSPVMNSVFIIPPSPLTATTFEAGTGSSTPTSATSPGGFPGRPPPPPNHDRFTDRMEEEADLANVVGWGASTHILSEKRSYERIVAPRPQRASRGLEHVINASSPMLRSSSLASPPPLFASPPPPSSFASPPPMSSSPRIPSASSPRMGGKAAWAFSSLKSALSNSMSHLVELARSRSPSPLPWLMRGSTTTTGATLSGAAAALESARQASSEELDLERSTSCVTPTPAAASGSHSRRSSTTTITGPTLAGRRHDDSYLPVLKLQVNSTSADPNRMMMMGESPPPKRTLSTSSLSSLGSEPDSESGSSGGIFSRSPSPEPGSERLWDPAYTLTPRSRPISADAKAAAACGGRLSPMMIPGSWDPEELWAEDGDLAKTW